LLLAAWCVPWSAGAPAEEAPRPVALPEFHLTGTGSCASAACHNADGPRGSWRSEYGTWINFDPHAQAYAVLYDDRSKTIQDNLSRQRGGGPRAAPQNALCLRCHSCGVERLPHGEEHQVADGVGCESCHGPAEKWKSLHYRDEWKAKTPAEKEALGFRNTKDL